MAVAFETSNMILSKEQAEHINYRDVDINQQHALKFKRSSNRTVTLALLMWKTWVPELEGNYEIIERGFKHGHGEYYIYVFGMGKMISTIPMAFPVGKYVCILGGKRCMETTWLLSQLIPFQARCYHQFLKSRRLVFCWLPNSFHIFYSIIYFLVYLSIIFFL